MTYLVITGCFLYGSSSAVCMISTGSGGVALQAAGMRSEGPFAQSKTRAGVGRNLLQPSSSASSAHCKKPLSQLANLGLLAFLSGGSWQPSGYKTGTLVAPTVQGHFTKTNSDWTACS